MWDIAGNLIQLELGENVIKAYSTSSKDNCSILIKQISQLRTQLKTANIVLPAVNIRDSSELKPDEYVLYMGILFLSGNYKLQSPVEVLSFWAQQFHIKNYSFDDILLVFNTGVEYVVSKDKRDYHKAISEFTKAYYCASMVTDAYAIMINSAINICSIEMENGDIDYAFLDAQRAVHASLTEGFHDPYIKYHSLMWLSIINIKKHDFKNALRNFINAFNVISETGESQFKISSLWAIGYLAVQQGDVSLSTKALDAIVEILDSDHKLDFDKEFYITLMKFRIQVSNIKIDALELELEKLKSQYNRISRRFLYRAGEGILSIVHEIGPTLINICMGSLIGGTKNFSKGDIIYGHEVTVYKEK